MNLLQNTMTISTPLPLLFKKYFWDCDFSTLTLEQYPRFISERILNYGDLTALQWLLRHVDKELIRTLVSHSRSLDDKTRNFWKLMLTNE
jgi:hypothetical protein